MMVGAGGFGCECTNDHAEFEDICEQSTNALESNVVVGVCLK